MLPILLQNTPTITSPSP